MRTKIIILGNAYDHPRNQNDRVVIDPKGLSPCIQAGAGMGGGYSYDTGNQEIMKIVRLGYLPIKKLLASDIYAVISLKGISPTIVCAGGGRTCPLHIGS